MRVGASLQRRITSNGPGRGILEPPDRESWSSLGPAKVGTAECLRFQDGDATWRSPWAAVPPFWGRALGWVSGGGQSQSANQWQLGQYIYVFAVVC